ncbi:MAG TPA: hypothetical protein VJ814_05305 [Gaiellaceae bacterium]|nr:hypothetical protein [Gaiellaceae bacterium]
MKRYVLIAAAALSIALGIVGGALAGRDLAKPHGPGAKPEPSHTSSRPSLIPSVAPQLDEWLKGLHAPSKAPKPAHHKTSATHKAAQAAPKQKPQPAPKPKPQPQPRPAEHLRGTTSIYEHTTKPWVLAEQGCAAAQRQESGVVVLDFGKPAFRRHGYGTILFSGHFALNHQITRGMVGYAQGYVSCLPAGSAASIILARGTSNYHPEVPSAYTAGVRWARATNKLGRILHHKGLDAHVESAAADDAEPAWDPAFHQTKHFFHGFRAAVHGHTLYDYGSLDGGVGAIWSAKQAWYVAGGIRHTAALPEIYNTAMAQQWAELAWIAHSRYHRGVHFAGVMTQGTPDCDCGLRPHAAHRVLADALDHQGVRNAVLPRSSTNIVG